MTIANPVAGRVQVFVVNTSGTYSATLNTPTGTALTLTAPTAKGNSIFGQIAHALRVLDYSETTEISMLEKGNDSAFRVTRTGFVRDGQVLSLAAYDGIPKPTIFESNQ